MPDSLIVVLGPTASGKTRLGVELARHLGGEIISADSRQVYRGLDLGTGKDLQEYQEIPHHLIDIVDPGHEYSLFEYQQDFSKALAEVRAGNHLPLLVGGTGLYLDAVLRGYALSVVPEDSQFRAEAAGLDMQSLRSRLLELRPDQHNTTDLLSRARLVRAIEIAVSGSESNARRLDPIPAFVLGIHLPRPQLRKRITERLKVRLDQGLIEEVAALQEQGVSRKTLDFYGLEYRFVAQYLGGELNRNDMFQKLNAAIHRFAKRQETWFRKMAREGVQIHWLDGTENLVDQALLLLDDGFQAG